MVYKKFQRRYCWRNAHWFQKENKKHLHEVNNTEGHQEVQKETDHERQQKTYMRPTRDIYDLGLQSSNQPISIRWPQPANPEILSKEMQDQLNTE